MVSIAPHASIGPVLTLPDPNQTGDYNDSKSQNPSRLFFFSSCQCFEADGLSHRYASGEESLYKQSGKLESIPCVPGHWHLRGVDLISAEYNLRDLSRKPSQSILGAAGGENPSETRPPDAVNTDSDTSR